MELLQINLQHSKLATLALVNKIMNSNISIILVQEPWLNGLGAISGFQDLKNFEIFFKSENKIRACILVKKDIKAFLLGNYSSGDLVAVACEKKGFRNLCVVSSYFPYEDMTIPSDRMRTLVDKNKWDIVIGCDSNAHHTQWGSTDINPRGELFFEYIMETNLEICNVGNNPTFISKIDGRKEVLDVTLVGSSNKCSVSGWKVLTEVSLSDHCWIFFKLNWVLEKGAAFRNPKKADWTKYEEICQQDFCNLKDKFDGVKTKSEMEFLANRITDILNNAFNKSCKLIKEKKRNNPPWWNKDISAMMKKSRKLLNESRKRGLSEEQRREKANLYKESNKHLKYMIRKQKRLSWRSFCEAIKDTDELSRFRKVLSKSQVIPTYIAKSDGSWTESSDEVLESLFDLHFPGNSVDENSSQNKNGERPSWEQVCSLITEDKVNWAIDSFEGYKSPGPDSIRPIMLQKIKHLITPFLVNIYRHCLLNGYIPSRWKEVRVTFIPKTGKPSHITAKDFRPISLSSFCLKTMERIIDMDLRKDLDFSVLSQSQHAYVKGKSVETALHSVVSSIEYGMENKIYTLAAFIDIEGAFNNVTTSAIRKGLREIGTEDYVINWITYVLENRTIISELGESTRRRNVNRGTPQGGVISPLLWLVVVNMILKKFDSDNTKVVCYADDLVILIQGKFINTITDLMENALNTLKNWCVSCGLNVNPTKTELVLFTNKYKIPDFKLPAFGGVTLKLSESAKYLGIILDSKLNWNKNIEERRKKAYNALYACKKCIGKKWGLKPGLIHWMYIMVVRPILTYGSLVWWQVTEKDYIKRKLKSLQRAASIGITGAFRTTPSDSLEWILNLAPLDLEIKQIAAMSAIRLENYGLFKRKNYGHSSILVNNIFGNVSNVNSDEMIEILDFTVPFEISFPNRDDWNNNKVLRPNEISIFTDGSKMDSGVGAGVFSDFGNIKLSYKLRDECTVFQAEVFGILKAAEQMRDISGKDISFFIDSQAAMRAVGSYKIRSRIVKTCREFLTKLALQNNVRLCWVPGHEGHLGNEEVDKLAKTGSESNMRMETLVLEPIAAKKNRIREITQENIISKWERNSKCRTTKTLWPSLNKRRSKNILKFNKCQLKKFTGIITGHCAVKKMLKKIGKAEDDSCRYCYDIQAEESVEHLLGECEAIARTRFKYLGEYFIEDLESIVDIPPGKLIGFFDAIKCF